MSLARCKEEVSAPEFKRWQAYFRVSPFGEEWLQAATIAAAVQHAGELMRTAIFSAAGVQSKASFLSPQDYIPYQLARQKRRRRSRTEWSIDTMSAKQMEQRAAARYG